MDGALLLNSSWRLASALIRDNYLCKLKAPESTTTDFEQKRSFSVVTFRVFIARFLRQ